MLCPFPELPIATLPIWINVGNEATTTQSLHSMTISSVEGRSKSIIGLGTIQRSKLFYRIAYKFVNL